jgi:hypothetical protein
MVICVCAPNFATPESAPSLSPLCLPTLLAFVFVVFLVTLPTLYLPVKREFEAVAQVTWYSTLTWNVLARKN